MFNLNERQEEEEKKHFNQVEFVQLHDGKINEKYFNYKNKENK